MLVGFVLCFQFYVPLLDYFFFGFNPNFYFSLCSWSLPLPSPLGCNNQRLKLSGDTHWTDDMPAKLAPKVGEGNGAQLKAAALGRVLTETFALTVPGISDWGGAIWSTFVSEGKPWGNSLQPSVAGGWIKRWKDIGPGRRFRYQDLLIHGSAHSPRPTYHLLRGNCTRHFILFNLLYPVIYHCLWC